MDREYAETYLRLLADAELRRAMTRTWGTSPQGGGAARVKRVGQVLTVAGALDDEVADQILDEFELALAARQAGSARQRGLVLGSLMRSAAERGRPAMPASIRPSAAGMPAAARRVVRLGQMITVRGADVSGEIYLLSYARTASGPQFSVFARTRRRSGAWEPSGPRFFDRFTATDDRVGPATR